MRYDLSDKEWSIIRSMFPIKPRGVTPRRRPAHPQWHFLGVAIGRTLAKRPLHLWSTHYLLQSIRSLAEGRYLGQHHACVGGRARCCCADDRHVKWCASTRPLPRPYASQAASKGGTDPAHGGRASLIFSRPSVAHPTADGRRCRRSGMGLVAMKMRMEAVMSFRY
jgi:hypothetical protein